MYTETEMVTEGGLELHPESREQCDGQFYGQPGGWFWMRLIFKSVNFK